MGSIQPDTAAEASQQAEDFLRMEPFDSVGIVVVLDGALSPMLDKLFLKKHERCLLGQIPHKSICLFIWPCFGVYIMSLLD